MKTASQIQDGLDHFYGCDTLTKINPFSKLVATEGIVWLCNNADCFWLMDIICSYQRQCMKDKSLREIQFWKLKVDLKEKTAIIKCERDTDDVFLSQEIPYTDFPLEEITIYVENDVICLPNER